MQIRDINQRLSNFLYAYISSNGHEIGKDRFNIHLTSNASFPSLKAISDTLDYFDVDNVVAEVPISSLAQLPKTFLSILSIDGQESIASVHQLNNNLKIVSSSSTNLELSREQFLEIWNGLVIVIDEKQKEKVGKKMLTRRMLFAINLMLVLGLWGLYGIQWQTLVLMIPSMVGIAFTYYAIREELGLYSPVLSKFCQGGQEKYDCSTIIKSKYGRFLGMTFSDISLIYFTGYLMLTLMGKLDLYLVVLVSFMAIPVVIYSLYIQSLVLKKWCLICLGIMTSVFVSLGTGFMLTGQFSMINPEIRVVQLLVFLGLTYSWSLGKQRVQRNISRLEEVMKFNNFKQNESNFSLLLENSAVVSTQDMSTPLCLGNPLAPLKITAVTNPNCGFCGDALVNYNRILKRFGTQVRIDLVFNITTDGMNPSAEVAKSIISDYHREGWEYALRSLMSWFDMKDPQVWQSRLQHKDYPLAEDILQKQVAWCRSQNLYMTPTTIIRDRLLPKYYELNDLMMFMNFLIEQSHEELPQKVF